MKRTLLIFGATGEIGGRVARLCVDAGHRVIGVSRGRNTRPTVDLDGVERLAGDKKDDGFMARLGSRRDLDVVIDTVPTETDVHRYRQHFKAIENFLFCGSTGKYVPLQYLPADEQHPWREPTGVNFFHQSQTDMAILDLWESDHFPGTLLCPTNIIGEGRIPLELWGGRNIDFFRMLKAGKPLRIAPCESIPIQSGYNWDLARAFAAAVDRPDAIRGETFIISCKRAIPLGRYLQTAMTHLGSASRITHAPAADLPALYPGIRWENGLRFLLEPMCFDIGKAERVLDYRPTHTTEQGLIKALEWCETEGQL